MIKTLENKQTVEEIINSISGWDVVELIRYDGTHSFFQKGIRDISPFINTRVLAWEIVDTYIKRRKVKKLSLYI